MATARQPIEAELPRGLRLGRYRIEEPVGQGGMGTVYRAFDETTNRNVALKVLAAGISVALRDRFLAECKAQAQIRHPHVMPVYDQGWLTDERPYFTMELLYDPVSLAEIVEWTADASLAKRYPRIRHWADPSKLIRDVLLPISEGIAVANGEYRIQHRDLKPDNILVDTRTRRPYVIDFGICRDMDDVEAEKKIVGTPRFLSTEQARGHVDERTDVWGLGAVLQYALSGRPPLAGSSQFTRPQVQERIGKLTRAAEAATARGDDSEARGLLARREQLQDPGFRTLEDLYGDARRGTYLPLPEHVSPALRAILGKALAPEPADRYATTRTFHADLKRWVTGRTVEALAETDATGAAVDAARRALQHNLPRAVGVVIALALGVMIGRAAFGHAPSHPDYRAADIRAAVTAMASEAEALAASAPRGSRDPRALRLAWTGMSTRLATLRARLARVGAGERGKLELLLAGFAERIAPRTLKITVPGRWAIVDHTVDPPVRRPYAGAEQPGLTPGLYEIRHLGEPLVQQYVQVGFPLRDDGAPAAPIEPALPNLDPRSQPGTAWVPAHALDETSDGNGSEGGAPALLVARTLVTCEQYAEYLDDLPAAQRAERIPPRGFHQGDPNDSSRWLARAEFQDRPVTGLSQAGIEAYVAWRREAYGAPYRLLTDEEWQRAAGRELLATPFATTLYPGLRSVPLAQPPRTSPYGIQLRLSWSQYGEVVRGADGRLVVKADDASGAWLAHPSAFARTAPYDPAGMSEYGFRVCIALD